MISNDLQWLAWTGRYQRFSSNNGRRAMCSFSLRGSFDASQHWKRYGSTSLHVPAGYAGISLWRHNMPAVVWRPRFRFVCRAFSSARCHFQHSSVVPGTALRRKLKHIYVEIVRWKCTQTLAVIGFPCLRDIFYFLKGVLVSPNSCLCIYNKECS